MRKHLSPRWCRYKWRHCTGCEYILEKTKQQKRVPITHSHIILFWRWKRELGQSNDRFVCCFFPIERCFLMGSLPGPARNRLLLLLLLRPNHHHDTSNSKMLLRFFLLPVGWVFLALTDWGPCPKSFQRWLTAALARYTPSCFDTSFFLPPWRPLYRVLWGIEHVDVSEFRDFGSAVVVVVVAVSKRDAITALFFFFFSILSLD